MGARGTSQRVFFNVFCLFCVFFGLFFAMLAFFDGLRKGRRAKRASKASERSSLVLLALVLKLIFGRLNSMPGLVSIFMLFWWFLACFLSFCFFSRVLARGVFARSLRSPVLLALVLELIFGCLSSMPGLVSMFLYIGITCAEISYIKLRLSLAFSCSPLPDLIYHIIIIGTCLKNDRASRSLLGQVFLGGS